MFMSVQRWLRLRALLLFGCSTTGLGLGVGLLTKRVLTMAAAHSTLVSAALFASSAPLPKLVNDISPSTTKTLHLIVLVHGWMGNSKEMRYMQDQLVKEAEKHPSCRFLIYSSTANEDKTFDGIALGGMRLANEISEVISSHASSSPNVTLSFVGNSLGGLYSRFALAHINASSVDLQHLIFVTTATPHLGVSQHTYVPLPRSIEWVVANAMQPTGLDLFLYTNVISDLALQDTYRLPLLQFKRRIAYANAFHTDFQVPTKTAAFLSTDSPHVHYTVPSDTNDDDDIDELYIALTVETSHDPASVEPASHMAHALDAMGWTKVFCDTRNHIPLPSIPLPFRKDEIPSKEEWSVDDLISVVNRVGNKWTLPLGHQVLVANSKSFMMEKMNAGGQPLVDKMAARLIQDIVSASSCESECNEEEKQDDHDPASS